jgi:hypothetical protein
MPDISDLIGSGPGYPVEATHYAGTQMEKARLAADVNPTVRQRLERRLAESRQRAADLEAALAALTPEFETGLNALARVGHF